MSTNVQMPSTKTIMLTHIDINYKVGCKRTWVRSCKMWNPTSFVLDAKASHSESWETIFSPPWAQWKKWILLGSKGWPQMQCNKPRAKGWGRPNWMHNVVKLFFEINWKKMIIDWTDNHIPTLGPTQDFRHAQCKFKKQIKDDVRKKWSCNLFKILF
jgi:hypothetical protein